MDLSRDQLRRELRAARRAQAAALPAWRDTLGRLFGADDPLQRTAADQAAREALVLGGHTRRSLLKVGGTSVAAAAVLAACTNRGVTGVGPDQVPEAGEPTPTTGVPEWIIDDVAILRTASSLEYVAIDAYQAAIDGGLVAGAVADAARLFQEHHQEHADLMEAATRRAGGEPFTVRNPVVWRGLEPALAELTDEASVIALALSLETTAQATYQVVVPDLSAPALRRAAMSISGVEARHAAVLAGLMPKTAPVAGTEQFLPPTTTAAPAPDAPVDDSPTSYQVAGAFGSVVSALGPASFMYPWITEDGSIDTSKLPEG